MIPLFLRGIKNPANLQYKAVHYSGTRPLSAITMIVLHDTESTTAKVAAEWFTSSASQGSAHLCLDEGIAYRTLSDNKVPWGARGANWFGLHIEQAGYQSYSALSWTKRRRVYIRAAWHSSLWCRAYGIRPIFLSSIDLARGLRNGITTHAECSKAFGGDHYDPGRNYPIDKFIWWLKYFLR